MGFGYVWGDDNTNATARLANEKQIATNVNLLTKVNFNHMIYCKIY
jgi:hypothetical protein